MGEKTQYPEHVRLKAISQFSQKIGEFVDWLGESDIQLCKPDRYGYTPVRISIQKLLADFFNIDLDKIEEEKQQMLEEMRALNAK
jgi:hypothetical protein